MAHPAPWSIDAWAARGTILYRVIDLLGNPLTDTTEDKAACELLVNARNEDIDQQVVAIYDLWMRNNKALQRDEVRCSVRLREELRKCEAALKRARQEIEDLKNTSL
jgi:hypothetical protein